MTSTAAQSGTPTTASNNPQMPHAQVGKEHEIVKEEPGSIAEDTVNTISPVASTAQHVPKSPPLDETQPSTHDLVPSDISLAKPNRARTQSEALGPATDGPIAPVSDSSAGLTLSISLMLITGARHPYKIDEKYLRNRQVTAVDADGNFDPQELSGYQLKELIWIDWRPEWDPRPANPSSIRLIILGRMIEDKALLRSFPFNLSSVNVVHMTVKPADLLEDDEAAGKGGKGSAFRDRDEEERGTGCRCVIL